MARRSAPIVRNRLPVVLRRLGLTWGELARRTLLPQRLINRLRAPRANPRLTVAQRVASALGLPVERLWALGRAPR